LDGNERGRRRRVKMETYKYELVVEIDGRREYYNTLEEAIKRARQEGYYVLDPDFYIYDNSIVRLLYRSKKVADIAIEGSSSNDGEIRKIRVD